MEISSNNGENLKNNALQNVINGTSHSKTQNQTNQLLRRTERKRYIPTPIPKAGDAGMARSLRNGPVAVKLSRRDVDEVPAIWETECDALRDVTLISVCLRLCRLNSLRNAFSHLPGNAVTKVRQESNKQTKANNNNNNNNDDDSEKHEFETPANKESTISTADKSQTDGAKANEIGGHTSPKSETKDKAVNRESQGDDNSRKVADSKPKTPVRPPRKLLVQRPKSTLLTVAEQIDNVLRTFPRSICISLDCSVNYLAQIEPGIPFLKHIRALDISLNLFESTHTLHTLTSLCELNMSNNNVSELDGISKLSNLRKINLSGNRMEHMRGLSTLCQLRELRMADNTVRVAEGLEQMAELELLDLSENVLVDMVQIALVSSLKDLDLSGNRLDTLDEAVDVLLCLPKLASIVLEDNPLASLPTYKLRMHENPQLKTIDHLPVDVRLRARLDVIKSKLKLEDMVAATTTEYMSMVQIQLQHKEQTTARLLAHHQLVESAFVEFESGIEHELEDCIAYAQSVAADPSALSKAWVVSDEGKNAWLALLKDSEAQRTREEEKATQKAVELVADVAAKESFMIPLSSQLQALCFERPVLWGKIKAREIANREQAVPDDRIVVEAQERQQEAQRNMLRRARDRIKLQDMGPRLEPKWKKPHNDTSMTDKQVEQPSAREAAAEMSNTNTTSADTENSHNEPVDNNTNTNADETKSTTKEISAERDAYADTNNMDKEDAYIDQTSNDDRNTETNSPAFDNNNDAE